MTDVLVVESLTRTFRTPAGDVTALHDVSFRIPRGQIVALSGRSGSGKTTLLNCISGLDVPTSGTVLLDGEPVTGLDEAARTRLRRDSLAFVFQTFGLLPHLTIAENVGLPLRLRREEPARRDERVAHLLDLVGLAGRGRSRPGELSGGQQQRVAIARALAASPRLLIADEPTGQLDAATGAAIMDLIRAVVHAESATALIATHDASVQASADRVLRISEGALATRGRHAAPGTGPDDAPTPPA
ncbi:MULTISPECIES: ABC transporter ATP-binding protein [unclassified Rathayibacter]|uniref:ABC transporter ATP-binding protein n=1 Tax=unclassified Rathayibacter TaxID=2609250 RepID=UPI001FB4EB10|nr:MULTISPECIES: ABC transporter ATP-binding protein [unclassified Rathayibacter]MCJ1672129.1 ABC transporter ATP-binding protein [Rathayibacter sp. VKM Ac-2929]MCJ1683514.1 ABC transporter ATP-binding protein [Rathayibacter sp. VKM Ac-2928]